MPTGVLHMPTGVLQGFVTGGDWWTLQFQPFLKLNRIPTYCLFCCYLPYTLWSCVIGEKKFIAPAPLK